MLIYIYKHKKTLINQFHCRVSSRCALYIYMYVYILYICVCIYKYI